MSICDQYAVPVPAFIAELIRAERAERELAKQRSAPATPTERYFDHGPQLPTEGTTGFSIAVREFALRNGLSFAAAKDKFAAGKLTTVEKYQAAIDAAKCDLEVAHEKYEQRTAEAEHGDDEYRAAAARRLVERYRQDGRPMRYADALDEVDKNSRLRVLGALVNLDSFPNRAQAADRARDMTTERTRAKLPPLPFKELMLRAAEDQLVAQSVPLIKSAYITLRSRKTK